MEMSCSIAGLRYTVTPWTLLPHVRKKTGLTERCWA
jgi:hypothetical protein